MKSTSAALAVLLFAATTAHAQRRVLVAWDHTWAVMHPMGQMPDIPAGGDADFDTTWYLRSADFAAQYNGPIFGSNLTGVTTTPGSYDSRLTKGPIGYGAADYFTAANSEFQGFGDNDNVAPASGLLTAPASGSRRAAYFRTTFTVPPDGGALINPEFRFLIDDGAYVYLDGELIMAINMAATTPANLDSYAATPEVVAAANGHEGTINTIALNLPAGRATTITVGTANVNVRTVKQILALTEGEHTLAVSVRNVTGLTSSDISMALEVAATEGCAIGATASNVTRNNAGTPYITGDDTFSFAATVTGFNAGNTWSSDDPAQPSGSMDAPVAFGPYPVSGGPKTLNFTSLTDPPCSAQVTATAPGGTLTAVAQNWTRHPQGTLDPADDTFTSGVLVDGQFVSNSWRIVSTTPASAAAGSPATGTTGALTTFGPFLTASAPITVVVADAADPSITATAVIGVPAYIGSKTFAGVTTSFLSAAPLPTQWVPTTGLSPVITMSAAGGDIWREFRSPVFDLTATGAVGFSMELVARETSANSNFEDIDAFRAKLIVTDAGVTSEINLIDSYDTDRNGMLNGNASTPYSAAADEFNLNREAGSALLTNILRMEAGIPASATSVQLVVEAKSIATNEFFDVRRINFSDQCGFSATAANIVRNPNGQPANLAAHTLEFTLRAVPNGPVSADGWDVSFNRLGVTVPGASVTSGAWNTTTTITGLPAEGGPITVILRDKGDATCLMALSVAAPAPPMLVGTFTRGAASTGVYSNGPATGWTTIANGTQMTAAAATRDYTTATVDLTGINGAVEFSMTFQAEETSTTDNFEAADTFLAELLLTDSSGNETRESLVSALDKKTPAGVNGSATIADDEFNKNGEAVTVLLKNSWVLAHTIPDNIVSARLRVAARVDATNEFLRLTNVLWLAPNAADTDDTDGDGVNNGQEALAGTDANNPASVFRLATLTAAGNSVTAAFPTVAGKFYRGYTSTNLLTWTRDDTAAAVAGNGAAGSWTFGVTAGVPAKYYRMAVAGSDAAFPATLP